MGLFLQHNIFSTSFCIILLFAMQVALWPLWGCRSWLLMPDTPDAGAWIRDGRGFALIISCLYA